MLQVLSLSVGQKHFLRIWARHLIHRHVFLFFPYFLSLLFSFVSCSFLHVLLLKIVHIFIEKKALQNANEAKESELRRRQKIIEKQERREAFEAMEKEKKLITQKAEETFKGILIYDIC